jgi:demethylmenaquinone methyltransferase/2-methoxy-6-polyprenyl-1,4-benzoquinol methylase
MGGLKLPVSTQSRTSVPGTQPHGARDEHDARRFVHDTFSFIAPRYDLLNHLLSFSFDKRWRRRTAHRFRHILGRPEARVLDLCCGTGDLAIAFWRESIAEARKQGRERGAAVWGSDFARPMLVLASEKIHDLAAGSLLAAPVLLEGDALSMPFPDASFDLIATAFGFRNLVNYEAGLREIFRILKPGGEVGILEFGAPHVPVMAPIYRFYFTHILPHVGGAISGSNSAYSYLPASVSKFPSPKDLAALMSRVGFADARFERWAAGIVSLHSGRRP